MQTIFISPSDLAFLYLESPWGFHQKYRSGIKRPPLILPKIFNVIDASIKLKYLDENMSRVCSDLPNGILCSADEWVKSKPIVNDKHPDFEVIIRGKIDGTLKNVDGTYTVIDFKTTEINEEHLQKYIMQLSCYTYCVKYPNSSRDYKLPVSDKVGLFVFEPKEFSIDYNSKASLRGKIVYKEYDYDEEKFVDYIRDTIIPLLAGDEPKPKDDDPLYVSLKQFGFEYTEE